MVQRYTRLYDGYRSHNKRMAEEAERRDNLRQGMGYTAGRKVWTPESLPIRAVVYSRPLKRSWHQENDTVDIIWMVLNNKMSYSVRLTTLRPDELAVLKEVVDAAFEMAAPICERNYTAELAHYQKTGEPSFAMYRDQNPHVVTREDFKKDMVERDLLSYAGDVALHLADQQQLADDEGDGPDDAGGVGGDPAQRALPEGTAGGDGTGTDASD